MRRISRLLTVAAVAALTIPACKKDQGGGAPPVDTTPGVTAPAEPAGKNERVKIAFVSNNPHEFWTIARRGTEKAAAEFNAEVEFRMPPNGTAEEQQQIVEDLMVKGVKGIAVSPLAPKNSQEFFDGIAKQIPLITQDSDLPKGSKRVLYLGTHNYAAGKSVGELVKQVVPQGGRIAIFVGQLDHMNAIERRQGVIDALAGTANAQGPTLGKYHLVDTRTDDGLQEKCKANAEDMILRHPDLVCLIGLWAYNPPAILSAVQDAKQEGKIAIVGFDENEETLRGIEDGHVHATVVQQPFQFGYESVRILAALGRGDNSVLKDPRIKDGVLPIPHKVISKENVKEFKEELRKLKAK